MCLRLWRPVRVPRHQGFSGPGSTYPPSLTGSIGSRLYRASISGTTAQQPTPKPSETRRSPNLSWLPLGCWPRSNSSRTRPMPIQFVGVVAGHSVGEITAAAGVGVLSAEQAMVFVRERGRAMAEASAVTPTSMTALIGGDPDDVLAALEAHGLTAANNNGSGQIVAAGTTQQLAALAAEPPRRTRLIPLSVAGAFHTVHMQPAVARLAALARAISTHDPRTRLLSNADGQVVHDGREVLKRLVGQLAAPVRWDLCMAAMADLGVTGLLEMPPAGTLTGIAKRNLKGVELFALNTPDQLEEAMEFVQQHGRTASASPIAGNPTWRLVVSPGKGQFIRTEDIEMDTILPNHSTVGMVKNLRDEMPVSAPHGGIVVEWLVENGDPVSPGQPLLRLHPTVESADATEVTR